MKTRKLCQCHSYLLSSIGNMDITRQGDRSVCIRTTGHDKMRFTVVLSAMADGRKLKPFVVFKGVRISGD